MKIIVGVKRVIDRAVQIEIKNDQSGIENESVRHAMNPFDEVAVEAAVRLKEEGVAREVVAVSVGPKRSQETLRTALAMGADRAILVQEEKELQPLMIAQLFKILVEREKPSLVCFGKQAIDDDCAQVGPMTAGLLGWPQGTFVSALQVDSDRLIVVRETDDGRQKLALALPSVLTVDLGLNQPRYVSLSQSMQARKKPLDLVSVTDFALDCRPHLTVLRVAASPERRPGIMVETEEELLDRLMSDAQVL